MATYDTPTGTLLDRAKQQSALQMPAAPTPEAPIATPQDAIAHVAKNTAKDVAPTIQKTIDSHLAPLKNDAARADALASAKEKLTDLQSMVAQTPEDQRTALAMQSAEQLKQHAAAAGRELSTGEKIAMAIVATAPAALAAMTKHGQVAAAAAAGANSAMGIQKLHNDENDRAAGQLDAELGVTKDRQHANDNTISEQDRFAQQDKLSKAQDARSEAAASRLQDRQAKAADDKQKKYDSTVGASLQTYRGDTGAQQASGALLNIDRALDAINDPHVVKNAQMLKLIAGEMEKVATGTSGDANGRSGLEVGTKANKFLSMIKEQLGNEPKDVDAQAFLQNYKTYLEDVSKSAHQTLFNRQKAILDSNTAISEPYRAQMQHQIKAMHKMLPPTVTQGGHTYNLNPETGDYE